MALLNISEFPTATRYAKIHDLIEHKCSKINSAAPSFAKHVQSHWHTIKAPPYKIKLEGNATGLAFELVVLDGLMQYGVSRDTVIGQVKDPKYNAEIDILIGKPDAKKAVGLMLKTSMRERWKQADRDAAVFRMNGSQTWDATASDVGLKVAQDDLSLWAVTVREKESETPEKAVARMRKGGGRYFGVRYDQVLSIFDDERMEVLLQQCLTLS